MRSFPVSVTSVKMSSVFGGEGETGAIAKPHGSYEKEDGASRQQ